MRTRTKVTIAASAAVLLASLGVAGISHASGSGWDHYGKGYHDGERHGRHGMSGKEGRRGHHGGRHLMSMFNDFDADGDGKLTQAEIDDARRGQLSRFDTDGNGVLSLQEYEALWLDAMRERMVDRFQNLDADGDATITTAEFAEPFARAVRFMDRNDDGAISRDDMGRHRRMRDRDDDDD